MESLKFVVDSITAHKARHATAVTVTGGSATTTHMHPHTENFYLDIFIDWLPFFAVFAGFLVSCILFYKTYLEIRLVKAKLDEYENDE